MIVNIIASGCKGSRGSERPRRVDRLTRASDHPASHASSMSTSERPGFLKRLWLWFKKGWTG
jgi:hypothetical protein